MDTKNSTASASSVPAPPIRECFACYDEIVYIGRLVEDSEAGEEVEVVEAVPCRRCSEGS